MNTSFLIPQNLLLYSDCVAPSLVGNIYGKYLPNVPNIEGNVLEIPYLTLFLEKLELLKTDGNAPKFLLNNIKMLMTFILWHKAV